MPHSRLLALLTVFALLGAGGAEAQLGGLIKKKVSQATGQAQQPAGEPVVFTNVVLEITPDRVNKLVAAKQAAKPLVEGAGGPAAIQAGIDQRDARQTAIYEKEVEAINAWDQKLRDHRNCLDSAFIALADQGRNQLMARAMSDPRFIQLSQALLLAQQKGDTAGVRKLAEQLDRLKQPSSVDTATAVKQCGPPPPPSAVVKEWADLKAQIDSLRTRLAAVEDTIRATEERVSGMNAQQMAMLCERVHIYNRLLKEKKQPKGYTAQELQTLADQAQAIRDLGALCP